MGLLNAVFLTHVVMLAFGKRSGNLDFVSCLRTRNVEDVSKIWDLSMPL